MGNTQPHNKTGRKVVEQKLINAGKTGVLSLSEHKLEACPNQVFEIVKLTTLDLSKNKLVKLNPKLSQLKVLKSLNVDNNKLAPGSMDAISTLPKLKTLSANNNLLGCRPAVANKSKNGSAAAAPATAEALPMKLPKGLKTILLSNNSLSAIPRSIFNGSNPLKMLEKLDLSSNNLSSVPESIANAKALNELNLDDNGLSDLPPAIGKLAKLKVLSLRRNKLSPKDPQPLPKELWTSTLLIDLNLHGNPMTTTQLNTMDGYDTFLSRRREVKNKDLLGGAMTDLEGCGLK
eukprot:CAMPEP_0201137792 /NCGR_PEP_ID=MMETSP0850-20130426/55596_1 /ASSEMBLY_ACC=CAM_ASM_000622 /TAXON_ID=183588 /ORGANISM="Pseudo-nitzschia fraudulenta, Strain WWA7" /LENGTH=289 /DNA_ID=CAMNT_0047409165 /DNA_START=30 /DNA_END=899 /DNA_ORIENTATION=-